MIKLSTNSLEILKKCLESHDPSLITLIESNDCNDYSVDFYNELRQIVGDELSAKGFQQNWLPNEYGLELENLIDEIGRLFM
jgi:hypothetical protein